MEAGGGPPNWYWHAVCGLNPAIQVAYPAADA